MTISQLMAQVHEDFGYKENLALAYQLSLPFLTGNEQRQELTVLIYKAGLRGQGGLECVGYASKSFDPADPVVYDYFPIDPIDYAKTPLSLIRRSSLKISSAREFKNVLGKLYVSLDEIAPCLFKEIETLGQTKIRAVIDYLEILSALSSNTLLGCLYSAATDFFDWCCAVALSQSAKPGK